MKCYHCSVEVPSEAAFCPKCGNPQKFTEIVQRALNNDQMATTKLYEMTYSNVYQTVRSVAKLDEDTVFDLIQNTYLKAFKNLAQLQEPEAFRGWIKTISRNLTIDYLRKKKVVVFSQMVSVDSDEMIEFEDERIDHLPEVVMDRKETERLFQEILSELSEEQRIAVHLHYFEDVPVKEIAKMFGVSEGTIKSRLNYGRKKIEAEVDALAKKGTKLYGLAPIPFLLLLFRSRDVYAAAPNLAVLQKVYSQLSLSAAGSAGMETAKLAGTAKAVAGTAGKGLLTKVIAGVAAVAVVGAAAVGIPSLMKNEDNAGEAVSHSEEAVPNEVLGQEDYSHADAELHFKGILAEYEDAYYNGFDSNRHGLASEEAFYLVSTFGEDIYYTYRDIDFNGTDELLIGVGSDDYIRLGGIYTYFNEESAMIVDNFNERSTVFLMNDGTVLESGGTSAAEGYTRLTAIAEDGVNAEVIFDLTYVYSEAGLTYYDAQGNTMNELEYNERMAGKTEVTDLEWRCLTFTDLPEDNAAESTDSVPAIESQTEVYEQQENRATDTDMSPSYFAGAFTTEHYCFELLYTDEGLFIASGELPYGGMFTYRYHTMRIEGNNTLVAEHDEGTDTYVMNSDGTMTVTFSGFLEYRSGTYNPHAGSVF